MVVVIRITKITQKVIVQKCPVLIHRPFISGRPRIDDGEGRNKKPTSLYRAASVREVCHSHRKSTPFSSNARMDSQKITVTTYSLTNADELRLYCQRWDPPSKPRGIVFLAHGFAEHCKYYEELAEDLCKKEFLVCAHDHVGHGRSDGTRVHIDDIDVYVRDVLQHLEKVREPTPDLPVFLVGHSMGGTITIKAVLKKPKFLSGVVLIGAAVILDPALGTPFKLMLSRFVGKTIPWFPVAAIEYDLITRDKDMVEKIKRDEIRYHGYAKAGWANAMLNSLQDIQEKLSDISCPLLVMHGEDDKICKLEGSQKLYKEATSSDKSLKIYPKAYHSLLLEFNGTATQVRNDISKWLEDRL